MRITTDTRQEAWRRTQPKAAAARLIILAFIDGRRRRGATCDETEQALELSHQSASARITELRKAGDIEAVATRPTRTGSAAAVYVVTRYAKPVQKVLF
jgi:predicted transcriptional regulator